MECSSFGLWPSSSAFICLLLIVVIRPVRSGSLHGDADSFVKTYDVLQDCKPQIKNERSLRTGAAVFVLNETKPLLSDFKCHYELETIHNMPDYRFHVYIDEMNFLESDVVTPESPCKDYVQFGRDTLFVTTHRSQFFCGTRSTPSKPSKAINGSNVPAFTGGQGIRMYVEESDSEMDLWISVSKGKLHPNPKPRILVMTITVVKKNCRGSSRFYRQCPHTPYCIRREFFCDGRVNCAWPDAEAGGTDEVQCDAEDTPYTGPFDTRGASNILLIVVMIIITIAFIVFTVIFGKKFIVMFCKESNLPRHHSPSPQNELTRNRAARVNLPAEPDEVLPALPSSVDDIDNNLPSAPPSYEDVIKENPGLLIRGMPTAPPSYTESCSATTTQV